MSKENAAPDRGELQSPARIAERLLCVFAGTISILTMLELFCLPSAPPLNYLWLGVSAAVGGAAILAALRWFILCVRAGEFPPKLWTRPEARIFFLTAVWCLWCYAACFLAVREGRATLHHNARYLFYVSAQIAVIFPLGYYLGRQNRMRLLWTLYDLGLGLMVLYLLYGCVRFARGERIFRAFAGHLFDLTEPRIRFGLNPNATGGYCAFFLILGLYRFHTLKGKWRKALFCAPMALIFLVFTVSESRSSFFALAAAAAVYLGAHFWRRAKRHNAGRLLGALGIALAAAVGFLVLLYTLLPLIHTAHSGFMSALDRRAAGESPSPGVSAASDGAAAAPGDDLPDNELPDDELPTYDFSSRALLDGDQGTSSVGVRGNIWRAVLTDTFHDGHMLLHGCSQGGVLGYVSSLTGLWNHTHNEFVEMLISYGLPGLLFFLIWLCWAAGRSVVLGLSTAEPENPAWLLPLTLLTQIINNMAEIMLVGEAHYTGFMFFLTAGYVGGLAAGLKKKTSG